MAIMDFILPIVMLLAGLGFGGVAVWLLMRASVAAAFERGRREASAETAALSERLVAREDSIEEATAIAWAKRTLRWPTCNAKSRRWPRRPPN